MTHKVQGGIMGGGSRRKGGEDREKKNTFRGHPCWRVHTTRALEGELSIWHAYSGCHVLINLQVNHISFIKHLAGQWVTGPPQLCVIILHASGQRQENSVLPWHVYCWGKAVKPLVLRCGGKPCRWQCPTQTSPLGFGRPPELRQRKGKTE